MVKGAVSCTLSRPCEMIAFCGQILHKTTQALDFMLLLQIKGPLFLQLLPSSMALLPIVIVVLVLIFASSSLPSLLLQPGVVCFELIFLFPRLSHRI